ncbi:MAG: exodeoxyribonuclease VII small subunit [Thermodesulfobacteriota bacterium]|nr:exodeoxyribonuclease VII small subunit [Thermodesulfobacteriota bacterium]
MAKKQTFEQAMEKLEQIVQDLESGDPSLDAAIKNFEEGIKLSKFCSEKLDEMEKRITVLMKNDADEIVEKQLDLDTDEKSGNKSI